MHLGTLTLRVVHTPGHTPGSISLLLEPWCLLAGDTLFRRGIGRTDLPGGDEEAIYESILTRLYPLAARGQMGAPESAAPYLAPILNNP